MENTDGATGMKRNVVLIGMPGAGNPRWRRARDDYRIRLYRC